MRERTIVMLLLLATPSVAQHMSAQSAVEERMPPIIDMHLHAFKLTKGASPPENPRTGEPSTARTSAELRDASLAALRADIRGGRVQVLGELGLQYRGMAPNDPRLEPYYALAEELNIPVGIHTGIGPPGTPHHPGCENFRVTLGNPILLEDVLVRHPRLRVYLMHGGAPYLQETKAILAVYPQVYVDLSVIDWILPREEFHGYLRELMQAGFGKRLLFGSDQMFWPEAIGMAVEGIESATFLTEEEKRDIFYTNAVRFLGLEEE